jgi:hypothetical protein
MLAKSMPCWSGWRGRLCRTSNRPALMTRDGLTKKPRSPVQSVAMSSKPELRLDWCSHQAAKYAVDHWHYSRTMPVGKLVKIGVWEGEAFVGCILFARGANNNLYKPYGLNQIEGAELVRVALATHQTPVSRIIKIALAMLCIQSPGMRLIISFADTKQGHHGGIYQAGNWIYTGRISPPTEYIWQGRWVHSMQIQTMIRSGHVKSRKDLKKRPGSVKHRYLMPLDPDMRARVQHLAKPYPKRAGSLASEATPTPGREGGATPTPALSES